MNTKNETKQKLATLALTIFLAFYFQFLLCAVPYRTEDFISSENKTKTYKEECYLRELLKTEEEEAAWTLDNAIKKNLDPRDLQRLICRLIVKGFFDKDQLLSLLESRNIAFDDLDTLEGKYSSTLRFIIKILLTYFFFTDFENDSDVLPQQELYDTQEIFGLFEGALSLEEMRRQFEEATQKLTASQMTVFEAVRVKAENKQQFLIFVTGPGGTGKSFLLKTLKALLELEFQQSVAVTATSGILRFFFSFCFVFRFLFHVVLVLFCFVFQFSFRFVSFQARQLI